MSNLWTLVKKQGQALPILTRKQDYITSGGNPGTGFGSITSPTKIYKIDGDQQGTNDFIDVVNTFPWTINPSQSRDDVPYILLTEKRILLNSNVANLANSIFTTFDSVDNAFSVSEKVKSLLDTAKKSDSAFVKATAESLESTINDVRGIYNNTDFKQSFTLGNDVLSPYDYLYSTEYTGFNYKIPYFGNQYTDNTISFDGESKNLLAGLASIAQNIASGAEGIFGALKPGTYIERARQFNLGESGRSVSLTFPLLNTRNVEDIARNWQLIFGLIYQNRPGRFTRSIIDLPVIYQAQIPGVVFMPFSYIQNLSIEFLGSRRLVDISVPVVNDTGAATTVRTIVPDAYQVNITLTGLNEETRNFLYASLQSNPVRVNPIVQKQITSVSPNTPPPQPQKPVPQPPKTQNQSQVQFINSTPQEAASQLNPLNRPMGSGGPGLFMPRGGFGR